MFRKIFVLFSLVAAVNFSTPYAHADAVADLMRALGMEVSIVETQDATFLLDSVVVASSSPKATSTPIAAVGSATTVEKTQEQKIAELRALVAQLTQRLLALLQARSAASTITPRQNPEICSLARPLSPGVDGEDVKILQRFLVQEDLLVKADVTGSFGPKTEKAVQSWQKQAGIVSSGDPYTTGFGLVNQETLARMKAACLSESAINRDDENELAASKSFFVKKVPMNAVLDYMSTQKNIELSYTVKQGNPDLSQLKVCWMLVSETDEVLTESACWSPGAYGTQTRVVDGNLGLKTKAAFPFLRGYNIVKLRLELFDTLKQEFDFRKREFVNTPIASDDTGTFYLFVK
ncbi:MAG: putative peptidoglycan binding domain [Candidatus Parcubacteria bacterium]|jgi:peptidoglycan hydrolase-like protein with peptidoglycan-binding domain